MENLNKLSKEQLIEKLISTKSRLLESEKVNKDNLFKTLITNTEEIVYVIDKNGTFLLSEGKGLSKLGVVPGEVVGSSVYEVYKDLPEMLKSMKRVLHGETITNEVNVGEIYFRNWYTPQLNDNGEVIGLLGLSVNITEQKIAENQFITEKAFTDTALDAQQDTFFLFEVATGKAIRWNKAFQKISGYTNEEIKNLPAPQSYYSNTDLELTSELTDQVIKEGTGKVELDLICKDGTTVPTEYMVSVIKDEFGNPSHFISIGRNITDRKKAEERINRFSKIFEDSLNEIYMFNSLDFKFTQVNNAALNNLGYTTEEILSITPLDIKPNFTLEKFSELINPLINMEKEIIVFETIHERKDGSVYDVEVHLQLLDYEGESIFVAIIMDITDKKAAQELIIESERKLKNLIDNLDSGVVVHGPDTSITLSNSRASELLGLSIDQMVGKEAIDPQWDFIDKNNISIPVEKYPVVQIIKDKKNIKNMMIGVVRPKLNDTIWVLVNGFPVLDDNNNIIEAIISFIDITDRKNAEDELEKQLQRLEGVLEGTNAGTWDWNVQTGAVIINERWAGIMGRTLKELSPISITTWSSNMHPEDLPRANELLEKHFNKKLEYFDFDFRQPHKNGGWVWVNSRGKVIEWTESGKPLRMSGTHIDISQSKLAEENFRTLFEFAPDAIYLNDLKGTFIDGNKAAENLLGYTKNELIGKNFLKLNILSPEQIAKAAKVLFKNFQVKGTGPDEWILNKKDGSKVPVEIITHPMKLNNKLIVLGIARDITERKRAESELNSYKNHLEETVKIRTKELEQKNKELDSAMKVFVGREQTIRELQKKIRILKGGSN